MPSVIAGLFRWTGALLFVISLGYFLFTYLRQFGVPVSGGDTASAVTSNVMLFTVFAVHHSIFARERVREWVAGVVPRELERSVYVWIASLLFMLVCAWWRPVGGVAWRADGLLLWLLRLLQAAGLWLSVHSATVLDIWDLAGIRRPDHLRQGRVALRPDQPALAGRSAVADGPGGPPKPPAQAEGLRLPMTLTVTRDPSVRGDPRVADPGAVAGGLQPPGRGNGRHSTVEFKTCGPYGWVRHPIYAGWLLFVFAASPMTVTRLVFAIASGVYLLVAIPFEERSMRAASQNAYDRYRAQVPWRLVPRVY